MRGGRGRIAHLLRAGTGLAITLGASTAAAQPREWLAATVAPEDSPSGNVAKRYLSLFSQSAGGKLRFKRRFGGVLGAEEDTVAELQRGGIQLVGVSLGAVAERVPELRFLEQPYLFADAKVHRRALSGLSARDPTVQALFARRGLVLVSLFHVGAKNISSVKRPVRSPADLVGLPVRSQPSDLHPEIWRSWGAVPKAIALTELNSALEIALVEAFDVPATWVYACSLDARIKHYTLTRHVLQTGVLVVNKAAWDALPRAWREKILDGLPGLEAQAEQELARFDEELIALLPSRGVKVIQPTAAEMAAWRAPAARVEAYLRRTGSKEELQLFDRVKKLIAQPAK